MKTVNQLKLGAILSYMQMFLGTIITLIYTPFMIRLLGQSEYGLYTVAGSIVSYLSLFNLGFGSSYIRFYSKSKQKNDEDEIKRLNGLFLVVFIVMGIVALFCGIVISKNVSIIFDSGLSEYELYRARILVIILSISMGISFPTSVFCNYITAHEKFVFQKILNMIKTVISPLVMLPILLYGFKSVGMVVVTTIISIVTDIIMIIYSIYKLEMRFEFRNLNIKLLKEIAIFSSFIAINSLIDQINWNVDKIILGRYGGTIGVAVYGVAAQLNAYFIQFSTSISSVFTPRIHRCISEKNAKKNINELFIKVGRIQFLVLGLIASGMIWFGKGFIKLWAGESYSDAYYIVILLVLPSVIPLIQNLGIEIQRAYNKHKARSIMYGFMAVINLFISIPLCKEYGGIGCAIGTAISMLLANGLFMNLYYHKVLKIDILLFWKNILSIVPSMIIPISFGYVICMFIDTNSFLKLFIAIIIYTMIYCISVMRMGINAYEKELFKRGINIVKGKNE